MDRSEENPDQSDQWWYSKEDDCAFKLDSSSSEESEPLLAIKEPQKRQVGSMIIDSDSDEENFTQWEKKAKMYEISSEGEVLDNLPTIIDDDYNYNVKASELSRRNSHAQALVSSNIKDADVVSQPNSSCTVDEKQCHAENLDQPQNTNQEMTGETLPTDEKSVSVVDQPRKRKEKTKHLCVKPGYKSSAILPAGSGLKKPRLSKKRPSEGSMIIDSDSDEENFTQWEKKAKMYEISGEGEVFEDLLSFSDDDDFDDDDDEENDNWKVFELIRKNSLAQAVVSSNIKDADTLVSQPNSSCTVDEKQCHAENLDQPQNTNQEMTGETLPTDEKSVSLVEQPSERKKNTKHLCLKPGYKSSATLPAGSGLKKPRLSKKRPSEGSMIIDSDSDEENFTQWEKKAKMYEISGEDENLDDLPTIIDDDDDDDDDDCNCTLKAPEKIKRNSHAQGQVSSNKKDAEVFAVCRHNSPYIADEKQHGGDNHQPPGANLDMTGEKLPTDEKSMSLVEQPSKRKEKNKHICVKPAGSERKKSKPSKKKPSEEEKVETCETEKPMCNIPGCFLHDLEKSQRYSGRNFKQNKDELIERLYRLFNTTIFDEKLPEKIEITWNKKMLQTAGLCTTSERQHPKRERYAKIQISLKVCDSADRLRDTLIHEICHAASWLLDGVRDSHGDIWRFYAKKSNRIHPELPEVTQCHKYSINYKIHYECTWCKSRIGRYTKSLDTKRFICAQCKGTLVLLPHLRKDGTPVKPHVRPFARYVQLNYRIVLHGTAGFTHRDVMKKLSKDFGASKQNQNP